MAERSLNTALKKRLINNEPFVYAHLIKYERPHNADKNGKHSTDAKRYAYLTDGEINISFNDGSYATDGTTANSMKLAGILSSGTVQVQTGTNTPYTAIHGDVIFGETSNGGGGTIQVNLPASPSVGDEVAVIDTRGTWNSNNCTIGRNGQPINTATSDLTLSTNGQAITLVYVDATRGWAYKTNTA